jgi:hypothetical protein
MFEDYPDPIVTGREELGAPKWACTIDSSEPGPSSKKFTLSWRGTAFGTVELNGLASYSKDATETIGSSSQQPRETEEGIMMWRYVPSVGEPGKADAEYAVLDPHQAGPYSGQGEESPASSFVAQRRAELGFGDGPLAASSASLRFEAKGWAKLPTVNHIVESLAEIPVYEVLEAKAEFLLFISDISGAKRID